MQTQTQTISIAPTMRLTPIQIHGIQRQLLHHNGHYQPHQTMNSQIAYNVFKNNHNIQNNNQQRQPLQQRQPHQQQSSQQLPTHIQQFIIKSPPLKKRKISQTNSIKIVNGHINTNINTNNTNSDNKDNSQMIEHLQNEYLKLKQKYQLILNINSQEKKIVVNRDKIEINPGNIQRLNLKQLNELERALSIAKKYVKQQRDERLENKYLCVACLENEKNISIDGCCHVALCDKCEQKMQKKICPICRNPYNKITKLKL